MTKTSTKTQQRVINNSEETGKYTTTELRMRLDPTPEQGKHFSLFLQNNAELWQLAAGVFEDYFLDDGGMMHGNDLTGLLKRHWRSVHPAWAKSPAESLQAVCQAIPAAFISAARRPLKGVLTNYVCRGRTYTTAVRVDPMALREVTKFHIRPPRFSAYGVHLPKVRGVVKTPERSILGFFRAGTEADSLRIKGATVWRNPNGVWYITVRFDRLRLPSNAIPPPGPLEILDIIWAGCEDRPRQRWAPYHGRNYCRPCS